MGSNAKPLEVLSGGEIKGPLSFRQILSMLRDGDILLDDSYRRAGTSKWQSIKQRLQRNRYWGMLSLGIGALFLILAGVWALDLGLRVLKLEIQSTSWPSAEGQITASQVVQEHDGNFHYKPDIYYVYKVGGHLLVGDCVYPECMMLGRESWAQSIVTRHPVGSSCRVYYTPYNPARPILEPGVYPHSFTVPGLGCMLLYTGTLFGILAIGSCSGPLVPPKPSRRAGIFLLLVFGSVFVGFAIVCWLP